MNYNPLIVLIVTLTIIALGLAQEAERAFTSTAFIIGGGTWFLLRVIDDGGKK